MSSFFQFVFVIACETNLHMATAHNVLWAVVIININIIIIITIIIVIIIILLLSPFLFCLLLLCVLLNRLKFHKKCAKLAPPACGLPKGCGEFFTAQLRRGECRNCAVNVSFHL